MRNGDLAVPGRSLGLTLGHTILMVEHDLGGGVQKHVQDLTTLFSDRARFVILGPVAGGLIRVSHDIATLPALLYFDAKRELPSLLRFLVACGISRIHYHHTIQLPWQLTQLPQTLNVPYDYSAHDYFSYCPQITLVSRDFRYCGEPDEAGCNTCLADRPAPTEESIEAWRTRFRPFIEGASRVLVPTPSVALRLRRHFPNASLVIAPHPEPGIESPPEPVWRQAGSGPLKVLVLGALNPTKGPELLEACALDAKARKIPVEFHLLGSAYRRLAVYPTSALTAHGPYRDTELDTLMDGLAPHLVWFPAQWPETYSYTLSAALRRGLPVAAPDFGAFHDRLSGRSLSWLLPWDTGAEAWNDVFASLAASPVACGQFLSGAAQGTSGFSYLSDYLVPDGTVPKVSQPFDPGVRAHARSWRLSKEFMTGRVLAGMHRVLRRIYGFPPVRRAATFLMPEYRIQMFRRWLGRF